MSHPPTNRANDRPNDAPNDGPNDRPSSRANDQAAHRIVGGLQHRIALALGVDERQRGDTVLAMQANNARRAPGYWIQLFLAMGIATLGLVLNSTAVVIGGMLVSPLMGPILELGMGFAVGSSLLVLRASLRVALSAVVVVAGAALITLALPFHEVTSEIAARTAPTALDLLVAIFCALTAAYTTVRPGADSTAAAAGTAIGIALVPPLCTIGFGVGTTSSAVAGGAALLFTANFSAILVIAVSSFLLLGFNQVDASSVEAGFIAADEARTERVAMRAHRMLAALFGSKYGLAMRLVLPALFLAAVSVPLGHALNEVSWQVRTRAAIRRIVDEESPEAVQTSAVVERHSIALRLLVVESSARAASLESALTKRIAAAAGVTPSIVVVPVADARMLAAATAVDAQPRVTSLNATFGDVEQRIATALRDAWPAAAGPLADWELSLGARDTGVIVVRHLGAPLGPSGVALFSSILSSRLGTAVAIHDEPIATQAIVGRPGRTSAWTDSAMTLLASLATVDSIVACVRAPATDSTGSAADRGVLAKLRGTDAARAGRLTFTGRGAWSIQPFADACPATDTTARK